MLKNLLIWCVLLLAFSANATHIVGGEIMYKYKQKVGNNYRYEITLYLYVDCLNGAAGAIKDDATAFINVFSNDTKRVNLQLSDEVSRTGPTRISDVNYKCIKTKPNACVDKYIYVTEIDFPVNTNGYVITFERCCRNKDIANILNNNVNSGTSSRFGATYWTEIKNVTQGESSPFFKALPPNFLCTNAPLIFDHSATDADGDSLVYELYQPYSGADNLDPRPASSGTTYPSSLIDWNTGYNNNNQIDGSPTLSINRKTGKLTLTPTKVGQYVVGIKVLEYRKGKLLGETKRDFQFNVSDCVFDVVSSFFAPKINCTQNEVSFQNQSQNATSYFWDFGDPDTKADTTSFKSPDYVYKKPGNYTIRLIAKVNICVDTFDFDLTVKQNFTTKLPNDTIICGAFTKKINANVPNKSYLWSTGERTQSITVARGGLFWVAVTDAPCVSRDSIIITNEIVKADFTAPLINCSENEVVFLNRSLVATSFSWDFGNTATTDDISTSRNPRYIYDKPGNYTVKLIAKTATCADTTTLDHFVKENFNIQLPNDTLYCGPFVTTLKSNEPNKTYKWSTGAVTPNIQINKAGNYWVEVSDLPCIDRDTIVIQNDLYQLNIGPDSVICRDSFVQFTYQTKPIYTSYLWNDNTTLPSVFVSKLGTYWLNTINQNNCPSSDTITFILYPPPRVNLNDTLFCRNTTVELDGVNYSFKTKLETKYLWNNGETTPQITTGVPGRYIVTVKNKLCTIIDTADIEYFVTGLELGADTFYCGPVRRLLKPNQNYTQYLWHDNSKEKYFIANSPGKKKVTITTIDGCIESDSVFLTQYPGIDGGLGNDTVICLSSEIELKAADGLSNYLWNTGAKTQSIFVKDSGIYVVVVTNKNGCVVPDSIRIKESGDALPIEMFMPNAYTPNDDGINEYYPGNKYGDPGSDYLLRLYNRWGEKVFESNSPSFQWDGKIKDKLAPQDVYVYQVKYIGCDGQERWFRGTFTLMR